MFVCLFILATNAFNSDGATDVLDVISFLNQHVTLHTDAVGSVPLAKDSTRMWLYFSWTTLHGLPFSGRGK